jgi:hypothetical protein
VCDMVESAGNSVTHTSNEATTSVVTFKTTSVQNQPRHCVRRRIAPYHTCPAAKLASTYTCTYLDAWSCHRGCRCTRSCALLLAPAVVSLDGTQKHVHGCFGLLLPVCVSSQGNG